MNNYPRHRQPFRKHAGYRICPYCGKSVNSRGIGAHIRLLHQLIVTTPVNYQNINPSSTEISPSSTGLIDSNIDSNTPVNTQELSRITGKDLSECKRPDGKHLYTDQDLWILLARINRIVLADDSSSFLSKLDSQQTCFDLIRDFEIRFKCSFQEVKQSNPKIKPGKTDKENVKIALEYSHLKYSRPGVFLKENWME